MPHSYRSSDFRMNTSIRYPTSASGGDEGQVWTVQLRVSQKLSLSL